jgi:hypothetical protein
MPFDSTNFKPEDPAIALYRERREKAAELWRKVPPERFDLNTWRCRSTACALGWLANERFDDWRWGKVDGDLVPKPPSHARDGVWHGAARYFGLSPNQTEQLFGCGYAAWTFYERAVSDVRPADVAERLLQMPYLVWPPAPGKPAFDPAPPFSFYMTIIEAEATPWWAVTASAPQAETAEATQPDPNR